MDDSGYGNLARVARQAWLRSTDTTAFPPGMVEVCEKVYAAGLVAGLLIAASGDPIAPILVAEAKAMYEDGGRDAGKP
jgi:hypothetical protein